MSECSAHVRDTVVLLASTDPAELVNQLRSAANKDDEKGVLYVWTGRDGLFARAADVIERLLSATAEQSK